MGAEEIFISVIMPTYNRSYCIEKAINSLLCQNDCAYELIIIDDGSTDDTENIIKNKYKDEIAKEIVVYKKIKHGGAAAARNEGLKLAKGEWIGYLDSDNLMVNNYLELYKKAIKEHPSCKMFYAKMYRRNSKETVGQPFDRELLLQKNFIDMGAMIHHRECVDRFGVFDEKLKRFIDYELILRYTQYYEPVFIDEIVLEYDDSSEKKRITNTEKFDEARKYIVKKYGIQDSQRPDCLTIRGKLLLFLLKLARLLKLLSKDKYFEERDLIMIATSTLFNEKWYLKNVKDINICAAEHYYRYGWKDGVNPSVDFDGNDYLKRYPDVALKKKNPLLHYLQTGAKEGRRFNSCAKN